MTILAPRTSSSAMMALLSNALSAISAAKAQPVDERRDTDRVEALSRQQHETDEIAERVGERQNLGRHAAFRASNGLALSPPFAPWPWRWTLTMVASTMAYSMSGSSGEGVEQPLQDIRLYPVPKPREDACSSGRKTAGRSRHGLPVRAIHKTASTNSRLSLPLRPGSAGLPRHRGSIFAHWASVRTNRSIQSLNHAFANM